MAARSRAGSDLVRSYVLTATALVLASPVDGATYYLGSKAVAPDTTADQKRIYIPKAGVIRAAYIHWFAGTAGSNENISVYIRLNNTTDTLVETIGDANAVKLFDNTSLAITVAQGDYIEIKIVSPTWGTNPANVNLSGQIYVEG